MLLLIHLIKHLFTALVPTTYTMSMPAIRILLLNNYIIY